MIIHFKHCNEFAAAILKPYCRVLLSKLSWCLNGDYYLNFSSRTTPQPLVFLLLAYLPSYPSHLSLTLPCSKTFPTLQTLHVTLIITKQGSQDRERCCWTAYNPLRQIGDCIWWSLGFRLGLFSEFPRNPKMFRLKWKHTKGLYMQKDWRSQKLFTSLFSEIDSSVMV